MTLTYNARVVCQLFYLILYKTRSISSHLQLLIDVNCGITYYAINPINFRDLPLRSSGNCFFAYCLIVIRDCLTNKFYSENQTFTLIT